MTGPFFQDSKYMYVCFRIFTKVEYIYYKNYKYIFINVKHKNIKYMCIYKLTPKNKWFYSFMQHILTNFDFIKQNRFLVTY